MRTYLINTPHMNGSNKYIYVDDDECRFLRAYNEIKNFLFL